MACKVAEEDEVQLKRLGHWASKLVRGWQAEGPHPLLVHMGMTVHGVRVSPQAYNNCYFASAASGDELQDDGDFFQNGQRLHRLHLARMQQWNGCFMGGICCVDEMTWTFDDISNPYYMGTDVRLTVRLTVERLLHMSHKQVLDTLFDDFHWWVLSQHLDKTAQSTITNKKYSRQDTKTALKRMMGVVKRASATLVVAQQEVSLSVPTVTAAQRQHVEQSLRERAAARAAAPDRAADRARAEEAARVEEAALAAAGWKALWGNRSGKIYYWNAATSQNVWDHPMRPT